MSSKRSPLRAVTATSSPRPEATSRQLMIDHYAQHLRTTHSRKGRPYSEETIRTYTRAAIRLARWLDSKGIPGDLTPACDPQVLNDYHRDYSERHSVNGAAHQQNNLGELFDWPKDEIGNPNPINSEEFNRFRSKIVKPKTLSREFIDELLASCDRQKGFMSVRDLAIIRLLLDGLRIGEVIEISVDDVPPLDAPILRVPPHKGDLNYTQGRRIRLDLETVRALHRYLRMRAAHPKLASRSLWISVRTGRAINADSVRTMLLRRANKLGYERVHPHMFRHTFSHDYLDNGGSPEDLSQHNGWKPGSAMPRRYGQDMAEDRAIAARERLGRLY
jgi:integrase